MPRVVHFELLSDDPEQSVKFFQRRSAGRASRGTGRPTGSSTPARRRSASTAGSCASSDFPHTQNALRTIDVDDIGEALAKVEAAGGKVIAPERQVGEAGWAAYAADPQGVVFGLWKSA